MWLNAASCSRKSGVRSFLLLQNEAGSKISPSHNAAGNQFVSRESSLKNFEDSLGPQRNNHVKNHKWWTFTVLVLWDHVLKFSQLTSFFLYSQLHHAAGSQTSNLNNSTTRSWNKRWKDLKGANWGPRYPRWVKVKNLALLSLYVGTGTGTFLAVAIQKDFFQHL
jgi:hypothetical protein